MTKKLVDFGFSSPKISPVYVCESGQQNLRPNVHKSGMFHDVRPTYLKIGTFDLQRFVSFDNFHFLISPVYVLKLVDFVSISDLLPCDT